jgi:arginase
MMEFGVGAYNDLMWAIAGREAMLPVVLAGVAVGSPDGAAMVGSRPVVVIEAPSNLGLKPPAPGREPGVRRLPETIRRAGLDERLKARWGGRVEPPPYTEVVDPKTRVRNSHAIARYSVELAGTVGAAIDRGGFPLVLGGDCSIVLGNLLALRLRGRYGLFFLDGHTDFLLPSTSESHGAAGMDLALATGRGPEELTRFSGFRPLVRDEDVVILGTRGNQPRPARSTLYSVDRLRAEGIRQAVRREVARLRVTGVRGFWIHIDADVLDASIMPAVDSPQTGGLTFEELAEIVRELLDSGSVAGMHVGIYDPDLDPDGRYARGLSGAIAEAFGRAGP